LKNEDKIKEKQKLYNIQNGELIKGKKRIYEAENRDKIKERKKEYKLENLEKVGEFQQKYRTRNKVKLRGIQREYQTKNREVISEKKREIGIEKNKENNPNYLPPARAYSWKNRKLTRDYFESTASLFHITNLSDWYRVSRIQIEKTGGIFNQS
jgi:hypothetical protein